MEILPHASGEGRVVIPRELVLEMIKALRLGAEAVLDRDWDCYSAAERDDAEGFVAEAFTNVAEQLLRLLDA
jgi:hypothetical protein